jgi:cation:H+ antiporter
MAAVRQAEHRSGRRCEVAGELCVNFADWPMWLNMAVFGASAALVWSAGSRLARYADAIAEQTGIGREFLGMILLGGVTSLPELAVATTATLEGAPTLSINDVLGSAGINIVILAVADVVIGRKALTSMQSSPGVMLQGVIGIVLMSLIVGAGIVGDRPFFGIGLWSWLLLGLYITSVWLMSKAHANDAWRAVRRHAKPGKDGAAKPDAPKALWWKTVGVAAAILLGGFLLARSGNALASQSGLGTSFFGAVFLGFATSLPEVSTVIAAVRLRRYEMAISDVFGTNLFNVTIIVLVDALHPGGAVLVEAGRFAGFAALLALVLTAFYLVGMLERRDRTILRMGIDSIAVLVTYCAGVAVLHAIR